MSVMTCHHNSAYYRTDETRDYYAYPKYSFRYRVYDEDTGDNKRQYEIRDGSMVKGYYRVNDPDGTVREVHYRSDNNDGFTSKVNTVSHRLKTPFFRSSVTHY
ncbi:hypothetical protein O3M35_000033 [Rhynocoris fuscipes]|uniref:Uncharacterized protein n=1 Tax=Rhynocoris fuscipes TaxID=488301 RepID=A0AAW1DS28_9HEMI